MISQVYQFKINQTLAKKTKGMAETERHPEPTNENLICALESWTGPVAIYSSTSDYSIAIEIKKESLIRQLKQYSPLLNPANYRLQTVEYEEGKTLLLRPIQ